MRTERVNSEEKYVIITQLYLLLISPQVEFAQSFGSYHECFDHDSREH